MSEINDLNETYEEVMNESMVITVPIDDTLSNSGEAADAAAVGAALALKADLSAIVDIDVNGEAADNQGHIIIDGGDVQVGGTDTRTIQAAIEAADGRTGADILLSAEPGAPTIQQAVEQAGAASAATIMMAPGSDVTVAQKISEMDGVAAANTAAIQELTGRTAETIPVESGSEETVKEALAARVKSVNGVQADENGNAELRTVPLAENLISEVSQQNSDTFAMRTAGGGTSIASGDAWLMSVRGNSVHTGYSPESLTMTVSEADEPGHISATIDRDQFVATMSGSGTVTMTSDGTDWSSGGFVIDPADLGVTVTGEPMNGDMIIIVYVEEVRGTITQSTPTSLTATGWNLYKNSEGVARVKKYSDEYGYRISGSYTALKFSTTYSGAKSDISVNSGTFVVPDDGYVWVTGGDSTTTAIWLTWSDWTESYDGAFAAYTESTVDFSGVMQTYFPTGLMKVGGSADEINLNIGQAISRVEQMEYSPSNLALAKASGREYDYDENYIYIARAEAVVYSISVDGSYIASDHGLEWFAGTEIGATASVLYGNNLRNKLERDVVQLHNNDQWINGGSSSTQLGVACTIQGMAAFIRADEEGGNLQIRKGNNLAEMDSSQLNDAGTGAARLFVRTGTGSGSIFKSFRFQQDGGFEDGNGNNTGSLYKMFVVESYTYAYSNLTSTLNVSASDFGIQAKTGYTMIGIIGYATGSSSVYAYGLVPTTSGTIMSLKNTSGTAASGNARIYGLWIRNKLI